MIRFLLRTSLGLSVALTTFGTEAGIVPIEHRSDSETGQSQEAVGTTKLTPPEDQQTGSDVVGQWKELLNTIATDTKKNHDW